METETAVFVDHLQRNLFLSNDEAARLSKELIERFLPIKQYLKDFDATICSPSPKLDAAWHELILFTKLYAKLCGEYFIHHNPLGERDDVQIKAQRYTKTLETHEEMLGAKPSDNDVWPPAYPAYVVTDDDKSEESGVCVIFEATHKKRKIGESSTENDNFQQQLSAPASIAASRPAMRRVVVRDMTGSDVIVVATTTTAIHELMSTLEDLKGVPASELRLIFNGVRPEATSTLAKLGVEDGDIFHLIIRVSGC